MSSRRGGAAAAAVAVVLVVVVSVWDMDGWDPTRLLRVGEQASARGFVETDLPDTHLVPGWGHDGQANYVLASVFPDLEQAAPHLDSVTYRARRIVYPGLVSWMPDGQPLVVGLWLVNLAAIGGAAVVMADLARRHGGHWLAGAAVGITPAFVASALIDLGDALALCFAAAGVWAWRRDRSTTLAVTLFVLAALTRETTLVVPAAVFLTEGAGRRRFLLIPPAVLAAWILVLEWWIGGPGKSATQFRPPFLGWLDPATGPREVALAAALLLGSLWVAHRLWTVDRTWAVVVLFDAAILACVDRDVLFNTLNLARVTPWVIPLIVVALGVGAGPEPSSADEDQLGGEGDPVVDGLVHGASPGHV